MPDPRRPDRRGLPPRRGGAAAGGGARRPVEPAAETASASTLAEASKPPAAVPPSPPPPVPPKAVVPPAPVAPAKPVVPAKPALPAKPTVPAPSPSAPKGPDPLLGRTFGRCKILERIGMGRTAVVYRAHHEGLGRDVAVKVLLPEVLRFPEVVAKFEQEARAIARLDHQNVLKIYDVVVEGDVRGIVMELLEGESVLEYLAAEERVEAEDALRIVRQAGDGLRAAHAKGIIHRDVKPQNLVILEDGTVKLVDFGLATKADSTLAAERIGTPHYMPPEACEAKPVGPESDVYSLGITLHHLLTGAPPYAGQSVKEILASHVAGKPLQPERQVKTLSPALGDLVRGMTKRDPLTRMSIDEVIATIDRIGGEDLVKQVRLAPRRSRHRRRARKSAGPMLAVVGGGVLVVAVVVMSMTKTAPPEPRPVAVTPPTPTAPQPTPGTTSPSAQPSAPGATVPPTPAVPVETEAEKRRREAQEQADRKERAEAHFRNVEDYARNHEQETKEIVRLYREVHRSYSRLDAGIEAKRRADGIEKGEIHPHPDKVFAKVDEVAKAREAWEAAKKEVEAAVATMRYGEALKLLPASIEDPERTLAPELDLWRKVLVTLDSFFAVLDRESRTLKGEARAIESPKGAGVVERFTSAGPAVRVGRAVHELRWSEMDPAAVADYARRAFDGKDAKLLEHLAAFAWAHRLSSEFFGVVIKAKQVQADPSETALVTALTARSKDRFAKK